jgi:hypothetical protein
MDHIKGDQILFQVRQCLQRLVAAETDFYQLLQRRGKNPELYRFGILAYMLILFWDHRSDLLWFLENGWTPVSLGKHDLLQDRIRGTLLGYLWRLISDKTQELMEDPTRMWLLARLLRIRGMVDEDTKLQLEDDLFNLLCMSDEATNLDLLELRATVMDRVRTQQQQRSIQERPTIEEVN